MVLVWWPLPKCSWRLEGASSWCWFDGHCRSVHGGWRGPRVGAGLMATAGVSTETGGASSWFSSGGHCRCPRRLEGASSWCWSDGHCRSVHGGWRGPRVGAGLMATAGVSAETGGASSWFCSGGHCRCPQRLEGASSWCWSGGHCRSVHGDWRGVLLVLFWWLLPVSTEAGGGLELVLVWWPLPKCSWRLEGASSWCWFDGHLMQSLPECSWRLEGRLVGSVLVVIAGVHGGWRGP